MTVLRLAPRFRLWAVMMASFAAVSFYGITWQQYAYQGPIFHRVRQIAPWPAWGGWWLAVCLLAFVAALTASPVTWRVASLMAVAAGVAWLVGISWASWIDGARLSWTGWALWSWFVGSNMLAVTARSQFEVRLRRGRRIH